MIYSASKFSLSCQRRLASIFNDRHIQTYVALAALILLGLHCAGTNAFMQDDAYISYRYAKWFSRGYGLVWYPGSTEFGYTNFLYTLLIGLGMVAHIPPEITSNTINVLSFVMALLLAYYIALHITQQRVAAFATVFLLATHHTFTGYATGGLETMFFTALILGFYALLIRFRETNNNELLPIMGVVASLALLTRLDAALLLFPGYVYLFFCHSREGGNLVKCLVTHWMRCASAAIIPALVLSVFLASCYVAYGYMLPNTFYIKVPDEGGYFASGFHYLKLYTKWQAYMPVLVPFFLLFYHFRFKHLKQFSSLFYLVFSVLIIWLVYILYVGGDFMEFRFLVPILTFYFALVFAGFFKLIKKYQRNYFLLVVGFLAIGNYSHGLSRYYWDPVTKRDNFINEHVANFYILEILLSERPNNVAVAGQKLHQLFFTGKAGDVKIAVVPAGGLSYFSELPIIDQLGLNTRDIINNHKSFTKIAGHKTRLTNDYMRQIGVNIVIDHPIYPYQIDRCDMVYDFAMHQLIPNTTRIYIPLNGGQFLFAYYLTPHPRIEQLIKEKKIFRCIP